jgi:hypothetical protein
MLILRSGSGRQDNRQRIPAPDVQVVFKVLGADWRGHTGLPEIDFEIPVAGFCRDVDLDDTIADKDAT